MFWCDNAGIVTPHRAQLSTIRLLSERRAEVFGNAPPAVDIVDRFRGQQRTLVLASYAVAGRAFVRAQERYILDPRGFNVTLTRARSQFVMVVSDALVQQLASDAETARDASHFQLFGQEWCRAEGDLVLPFMENGQERSMRCPLRIRG